MLHEIRRNFSEKVSLFLSVSFFYAYFFQLFYFAFASPQSHVSVYSGLRRISSLTFYHTAQSATNGWRL